MQNIRTVEGFQQSFKLVDHYYEMRESCFKDYNILMHGGNTITNQDYEDNISTLRVEMRKARYLSRPGQENSLISLSGEELNTNLSEIVKIAERQRQENILNVIRHNDFNSGFKNNAEFQT